MPDEPTEQAAIPVIDVAPLLAGDAAGTARIARLLDRVARDTGFFYIVNHGIPADLCAAQLDWARRFFAQPQAAKERLHLRHSGCMRGYEGLGAQTLDAASPPDLKESFLLARDLGPDHPFVARGVPNYGPNQWPDLPGFEPQMQAYFDALLALELKMMRLLAMALDLPADHFDPMYDEPMSILRLLHYPPSTAAQAAGQLGAGAHTDWGMLTFLLQDEVGGLEVLAPDSGDAAGRWLPAPPLPGSFVVNIGDMITRMTNGLYRSTMHRVRVDTGGRDRYSIIFFGEPSHFARIDILDGCIGDGLRFDPCTAGEHLVQMQRKTYGLDPVTA
ncbi:isopenicillin N synthase family dioxygenase [Marinibaculum pumilum]|uniref:Isopenicillin N synthase family dioxygenase n=1 Tax=Marinibaculum pumilum TaxID=1766165 RepID=A0ABV7L0M4_9PROT